ncbi:MAG: hypothetical protein ACRD00_01110 [Thermoanaerobaculia bacterium]
MKASGRRLLLPILVLAAAALCCAEKGDPAKAALDRMVKAAHGRDAGVFAENLAEDFAAADGSTRADALATLKRYFAAYAILDVTLSDIKIERGQKAAHATFRADLSGQPQKLGGLDGLLPSSSSWRFELRLVPDGSRWKVAWASWEPAER